MNQRNQTGMRLRQSSDPRKKDRFWLLQILVAALSAAALTMVVAGLAGIRIAPIPTLMPGCAIILCVVYGVLMKNRYENWFFLGVLAVILVLTLLFRRHVLEGFRLFWNQASDTMLRGTGWILPEWELQLRAEQQTFSFALFSGILAGIISLVCCSLASRASVVLALLLPATLLGGMKIFGTEADFVLLLPVLGLSVLILAYSLWRKNANFSAALLNWGVCAVAACFLLAGVAVQGIQNWSKETQRKVQQSIHEHFYETNYTGLPEGDFSHFESTEGKVEPALAVTMEDPQQMYLRGFTGAVFTEDNWQPLEREALAENKQLLYWLNLNVFDQNAQYDAASSFLQPEQSTVTVQNIGECSFYRYVPFSISKGAWTQAENLNTDGVWAEGERSYVYSVTPGTANAVMQVLTNLQDSQDSAVLQYRKAESGYRQYVYHYYLQIPNEVKALLQEQWDMTAAQYGSVHQLDWQQAQECALIFLDWCFGEDGLPEDLELPLKVAEGTSFQYATVAAMTLRYFGIPARYAEGYVISREMAEKAESGELITVDSSCGGAWVEVYQDGIGWIPMDLTPGMGQMQEDENSKNSNRKNNTTNPNIKEQEQEEPEPTPEEQPQSTGGTLVMILVKGMLTGILILMGMLLLIFLILWIRRKLLLKKKNEKFQVSNCSDAVAWIYSDVALLLTKLGFDRGNGSMRSLLHPLEEKFGAEFAAQFALVTDLNDRAMFSTQALQEEDRQKLLKFCNWTVRKLNSEVKWYRRLWLKWGLCLY